ncbi:HNH endonuclease signature motif containing protein [Smaragdicoccus niigatensis]|uniref:HNH endonuclease signature motif containing protein n=1 Tax=Smaragdicoccus niigatensis TaxID=359359 RepID=UPI0007679A14|nr:HNH endonuclease signature motif containing protein [Smaragdicoccus niigatensis]
MFDRLIGELDAALPDPYLSTDHLVGTVAALHRFESAVSARKHAYVSELFSRFEDIAALNDEYSSIDPWDALEAELGPALVITPYHASSLISLGVTLSRRLPNVWDAFSRGELDVARVQKIADATAGVSDDHIKEIERRILKAGLDGKAPLSGGRLRNAINRAIAAVDPDGMKRRREQKKQDRHVWIGNGSDGMAELSGSLAAEDAMFLTNRLGEMAKRVCTDDPRPFQARRADALMALVHGRADLDCQCQNPDCAFKAGIAGTPRRPLVHAFGTTATLNGTSNEPGWIDGFGVIDAEHLRELARDAIIRDLKTPTGHEDNYRPSRALADWVRALHGTCQFPGCDRPAWESDLDHRDPHATSKNTSVFNLGPFCRKHHRAKTFGGWRLEQTLTLISPLGFEYPIPATGPLALLEPDPPGPKQQTRLEGRAKRAEADRALNKRDRERQWGPDDSPPPF